MKRLLSVILALAMVLLLCACAAKRPDDIPETSVDPVEEAPVETETEDETESEYIGPQPVVDLARMLDEKGIYLETVEEDISGYNYDSYEHKPVGYYIIKPAGVDSMDIYVSVYDSAETAADEAANYGGGDGSHYSYDGGAMIIDYIAPVHFWLSDNCIIQYGSFDDGMAWILQEYLGEQFAGAEIPEQVPKEPADTDPV